MEKIEIYREREKDDSISRIHHLTFNKNDMLYQVNRFMSFLCLSDSAFSFFFFKLYL